ncbi:MAG: hypothetical protein PSV23_04440 [Brevundimonas sp.]|uniref:hypothetical protein n=1 Tax=Brevundimonas sp. TaxID=1871086 RepID=UPI00248A6A15|nr:hypothetical protein [Brevundimonas sp.]MDI1326030.1 hypothetical protein [Brevundimonas sp.]
MTVQDHQPAIGLKRVLKSVLAVLAGFITVAALSTLTDIPLHILGIYPPEGEPMFEPGLNILALSYRIAFTILGGYVTARLAPSNPMTHVLVLGGIGLVMGSLGAMVSMNANLGPDWYPIALVVTAVPAVWLGGWVHQKTL